MATIEHEFIADADSLLTALSDIEDASGSANEAVDDLGKDADKAFSGAGKSASSAEVDVADFGKAALAAAAAVGAMSVAVVKLAQDLNVYAKQAKRFGETAEDIQLVNGAIGLLTEGNIDGAKSLAGLERAIAEARDGTKTYTDEFEKLGIIGEDALDAFASQTATQKLITLSQRWQDLSNDADKFGISATLLKDRQGELIPFFDAGEVAIQANIDRYREAGVASNELAAQAEDLADTTDLTTQALRSLAFDVLGPSIPIYTEAGEELRGALKETQKSGDVDELGQSIADMAEDVASVTTALVEMKAVIGPALGVLLKNTKDLLQDVGFLADKFKEAREQARFFAGEVGVAAEVEEDLAAATERASQATGNFFGPDLLTAVNKSKDGVSDLADEIDGGDGSLTAAVKSLEELLNDALATGDLEEFNRLLSESAIIAGNRYDAEEKAIESVHRTRERFVEEGKTLDQEFAEFQQEIWANAREQIRADVSSTLGSIASLSGSVADIIISDSENLTKEQKQAAKVGFGIQKAFSIASATMAGIDATQKAVSSVAGIPFAGPALAAAAGIAMAALTAANVTKIASTPPPKFHTGTASANEFSATLEFGERVVDRETMAKPGAMETIDSLERNGGGSQEITLVNRVDNQTTSASQQMIMRTGRDPYSGKIESVQPYPEGLRVIRGVND